MKSMKNAGKLLAIFFVFGQILINLIASLGHYSFKKEKNAVRVV